MSDGPHRSLPLRPLWRSVAERADKPAFSLRDICDLIGPALSADFAAEAPTGFVSELLAICSEPQIDMFTSEADRLQALRTACSGYPLACEIVDAVGSALDNGQVGLDAIEEGCENALFARSVSNARGAEEHYLRRSTAPRALNVRQRWDLAIKDMSFRAIAQNVLGVNRIPVLRGLPKNRGIDEGVPL